ncbi:MAG: KamA family radical SAM protein [Candidatus Aenigmarchaeota archaeon]|nr:KamA family radical SAM protein [Candidatus Aenigmarchaeota archaeon]
MLDTIKQKENQNSLPLQASLSIQPRDFSQSISYETPVTMQRASVSEVLKKFGADLKEIERVKRVYPMKVSPYYLSLIKAKDDPIWNQCIPDRRELEDHFNVDDPLKEERDTKVPGLVHRYPDRVLLLVSSECPTYCRFCTRKRKIGRIKQIPMEQIMKGIDYIREHKEVRDVILSGGDPFLRTNSELEHILKELRTIPHLEIIRIGTRVPCTLPSRITKRLCNMLKRYHPIYVNIHFNHPSEITPESKRACELLADAGIPLGSQTVLLKGVNDSPEVMKELMQKLVQIRVRPYYLYLCDLVKGTEHFRTSVETAMRIMKGIQGFTSGLCVPHLVIDSPGGGGKIPILPQYIKEITPEKIVLTNYKGEEYEYPNPR